MSNLRINKNREWVWNQIKLVGRIGNNDNGIILNEWKIKQYGQWPERKSNNESAKLQYDAFKDILLHCVELHIVDCLEKFIWNNGDLELLVQCYKTQNCAIDCSFYFTEENNRLLRTQLSALSLSQRREGRMVICCICFLVAYETMRHETVRQILW